MINNIIDIFREKDLKFTVCPIFDGTGVILELHNKTITLAQHMGTRNQCEIFSSDDGIVHRISERDLSLLKILL